MAYGALGSRTSRGGARSGAHHGSPDALVDDLQQRPHGPLRTPRVLLGVDTAPPPTASATTAAGDGNATPAHTPSPRPRRRTQPVRQPLRQPPLDALGRNRDDLVGERIVQRRARAVHRAHRPARRRARPGARAATHSAHVPPRSCGTKVGGGSDSSVRGRPCHVTVTVIRVLVATPTPVTERHVGESPMVYPCGAVNGKLWPSRSPDGARRAGVSRGHERRDHRTWSAGAARRP